jgi:hypothetical protein
VNFDNITALKCGDIIYEQTARVAVWFEEKQNAICFIDNFGLVGPLACESRRLILYMVLIRVPTEESWRYGLIYIVFNIIKKSNPANFLGILFGGSKNFFILIAMKALTPSRTEGFADL